MLQADRGLSLEARATEYSFKVIFECFDAQRLNSSSPCSLTCLGPSITQTTTRLWIINDSVWILKGRDSALSCCKILYMVGKFYDLYELDAEIGHKNLTGN